MVVSMIIRDDWLSQVIYQKSVHVEARGPWVAIYLIFLKDRKRVNANFLEFKSYHW